MRRQQLINYRGVLLTADTAAALRLLEEVAVEKGKWALKILGPEPSTNMKAPGSLIPAGREVHVEFRRSDVEDPQDALNALWGCAVPLGFTPRLRHLHLNGDPNQARVFHFFGPWQSLYDRLLAEGRGHLAWPSLCCAAQVDTGTWTGDRETERFVQAQLHRIGRNAGPLDGQVGPRTAEAMESLEIERKSLALVAQHLQAAQPPEEAPRNRIRGHVTLPGRPIRAHAFGGVTAQQSGESGIVLTANGPGRVVIDVGGQG